MPSSFWGVLEAVASVEDGQVVDELNVTSLVIKLDGDLFRDTLNRLQRPPMLRRCKLWILDEGLPDELDKDTAGKFVNDRAIEFTAVEGEGTSAYLPD